MADERRIVIELKVIGGSSSTDKKENPNRDLTEMLEIMQHPLNSAEKALFGKQAWANYAFQQAKSITKTTLMYRLNRYFNLSENYKGEQLLDNTLSVISHVSEAYTSVIGGAIIGAKAGPVGAAVGAVVGAVSWGVTSIFDAWKAFDDQSRQLSTMNIQSSYQKVRLGLIDDGRGTQN